MNSFEAKKAFRNKQYEDIQQKLLIEAEGESLDPGPQSLILF